MTILQLAEILKNISVIDPRLHHDKATETICDYFKNPEPIPVKE